MAIREKVILEGEDRASKSFDSAGGSFERMGSTLKKVAISGGIAIAAQQLIKLGTQVTSMAIDADEAKAAFDTTFGQALPQAAGFVEDFANKAGFATYELEQLMAITGNVVQGIGATEAESAALSQTMVELAGDVASFSNAEGGAQAVMLALQSAINGEREALKTYGLAIAETEVQQRALNETGKTRVEDLTRLEKAEATVAIAYDKAGKAIGDLDRTQDSAANSLRRLKARFKEAGVEAGQNLLPAVENLLPVIEGMLPAFSNAITGAAGFFATIAGGEGEISKIDAAMFGISQTISGIGTGFAGLGKLLSFIPGIDGDAADAAQKASIAASNLSSSLFRLRNDMSAGEGAAAQMANELVTLAGQGALSADAIERVGMSASASAEEQAAALRELLTYANEENWRPENISLLASSLAVVNDQLGVGPVDGWASAMTDAGAATTSTGEDIEGIEEVIPDAVTEILELAEAAEEAAAAFRDDLAKEAANFITGFEKLPESVETTMDAFEENLTDRILASNEFWSNLAVLAEAGFGDLAEAIRIEGPTQTGLLDDLVADMERAAELDDLISQAGDDMVDLTDKYATALEDNADPTLTALGEFGLDMIEAIAAGIESGDLVGPLLDKVNSAVGEVTGGRVGGSAGTGIKGGVQAYDQGTWSVPGDGPVAATVHGSEIIIPPDGSGGRARFARELAAELAGAIGGGGAGTGGPSVTIEQINVLVPAGTTTSEAITAAGAQAAIEALLS